MKRTSLFSKTLLGAAVVTLSFGMQSCKNEPKQEDPKEVAEDQNEAKFDDVNEEKEKDSDYLVAASEVDMEEIELDKLKLDMRKIDTVKSDINELNMLGTVSEETKAELAENQAENIKEIQKKMLLQRNEITRKTL